MTNQSTGLDPDQPCAICGEARDLHGDKHHRFSDNGELVPIKAGAARRQELPRDDKAGVVRGQGSIGADRFETDPVARLVLRTVEVFTKKGLLEGADLLFIFGAPSDSN